MVLINPIDLRLHYVLYVRTVYVEHGSPQKESILCL